MVCSQHWGDQLQEKGAHATCGNAGVHTQQQQREILGLTPDEKSALHECLTWLRQPGNNPLCFYGAELEAFDMACKRLMRKVKQIIPEARYTSC